MSVRNNIAEELKKSAGLLKAGSQTSPKTPIIKEILSKLADSYPPGTPLPPVRSIAKSLGTTIATAHKALSEMKNEGGIVKQEKQGFSVGEKSSGSKPAFSFDHEESRINILSEDTGQHQITFWNKLIQSETVKKASPLTDIKMTFLPSWTEDYPKGVDFDIIQSNPFHYNSLNLKNILLNISDYVHFEGEDRNVRLFQEMLVPVYSHTYFVFCNMKLLKKSGLETPDFKTFAEQEKYFKAANKSSDGQAAGSEIQPAIFAAQKFQTANRMDPESLSDSENILHRIFDFCAIFRYKRTPLETEMRSIFTAGELPFLLGYSGTYWKLPNLKLPFEWRAFPLVSSCDTHFKIPIYFGVNKNSPDPAGSVQLITSFLETQPQEMFRSTGAVPVKENLYPLICSSGKEDSRIKNRYDKTHFFELYSAESFYIHNNILTPQFRKCVYGDQDAVQAVKSALRFAKAYLRNTSPAD
ncbi:MAG: hypothetical protein WCP55_20500 [Lentisphaerota bacterium]